MDELRITPDGCLIDGTTVYLSPSVLAEVEAKVRREMLGELLVHALEAKRSSGFHGDSDHLEVRRNEQGRWDITLCVDGGYADSDTAWEVLTSTWQPLLDAVLAGLDEGEGEGGEGK